MSTLEVDPESGAVLPENGTSPFPNPCEVAMDYEEEALGHVILQYRQSPRLLATVSAMVANTQLIEDCAVLIPPMDDPAIAEGVNLDVTGELVGQTRVLASGTEVNDTLFRTYIGMRILRNKAIGESQAYITALEAIFDPTPFRFYDLGGMVAGIELATGARPSDDEVALVEEGPVPRAMAVGVGRIWYDPDDYFGFITDTRPGRKGFGLKSDLTLGGKFAIKF